MQEIDNNSNIEYKLINKNSINEAEGSDMNREKMKSIVINIFSILIYAWKLEDKY